MFISLEYRYAFVHIPKTAGEWLFRMLETSAWKDGTLSIQFWGQDHKHAIDLTHIHQDILHNYIGKPLYDECISFCVVRNPYNRFYSAFGDIPSKIKYSKSVLHVQPKAQRFWTHKYPTFTAPSKTSNDLERRELFQRFCDIVQEHDIVNDTITKHNIHLIPQHKFVYRNENGRVKKNVDVVLRYEHLGSDLQQFFNKNKFPNMKRQKKHFPGSKVINFASVDPSKIQKSYVKYYTPRLIAYINKCYADDFKYFGIPQLDPVSFEKVPRPSVTKATKQYIKRKTLKRNIVHSHARV